MTLWCYTQTANPENRPFQGRIISNKGFSIEWNRDTKSPPLYLEVMYNYFQLYLHLMKLVNSI